MSAKSTKVDADTDRLLEIGKQRIGLSKSELLKKAVRYYVPRVISGEISVVEPAEGTGPQQTSHEPLHEAQSR